LIKSYSSTFSTILCTQDYAKQLPVESGAPETAGVAYLTILGTRRSMSIIDHHYHLFNQLCSDFAVIELDYDEHSLSALGSDCIVAYQRSEIMGGIIFKFGRRTIFGHRRASAQSDFAALYKILISIMNY
jgi:hypothetical protein